jgi:hypothetical protein
MNGYNPNWDIDLKFGEAGENWILLPDFPDAESASGQTAGFWRTLAAGFYFGRLGGKGGLSLCDSKCVARGNPTLNLPNPLIINALWGPPRKCLNLNDLQQLRLYHKLVRVSSIFFLGMLKKLSKKPCAVLESLLFFVCN